MSLVLSSEPVIVSMPITNGLLTKKTKILLCALICVASLIRVVSDAFTAISLGLVMIAIMILMATKSDVAQMIAGSLIVGSGAFIVGYNLGKFILS